MDQFAEEEHLWHYWMEIVDAEKWFRELMNVFDRLRGNFFLGSVAIYNDLFLKFMSQHE